MRCTLNLLVAVTVLAAAVVGLAQSLGVTTNTVYSRKFKIREKLQRIVRCLQADTAAA